MKIRDVETFVVGNPPPAFGGRYFIFVRLSTDSGVTGIGEAYVATVGPSVVAQMLEDVAARHLIDRSPFEIEAFWRRAYASGYASRPDITLVGVISALEMACWDIVGKETGRPVYELLGGRVHEALRAYTYLYPRAGDVTDVYRDPELAARRAAEEVADGFTAVKFDPAGPYSAYDGRQPSLERLELVEAYFAALREAVGSGADLILGTHGQFTSSGALRLARRIEGYDPLWFEEPVPPDDLGGMAAVAAGTPIPIATGERLATAGEFARVLELRAASVVQPNLGRCGGLLQGKKIAALGEVFGAQLAPHCYCGPIVAAANIQLATASPNFLVLESIRDFGGFHAELLQRPIHFEAGHVLPPTEPGLGVVLNEDVARAHPYTGSELHLQPLEKPVGSPEPES